MANLQMIISKFKLNVLYYDRVPDSFSSEVTKLTLTNHEQLFIKVPFSKDKLYREYEVLKLLEGIIPVPKVLDFWEGDESNIGAFLLSSVPGEPCSERIDDKLAFDIGRTHAELHEVKMPGYGFHNQHGFHFIENNDWRMYIKNTFENVIDPCKEILEQELFHECILHFDHVFKELPPPDRPCLIHLDFRPANIIVNENRVAGIIDFESSRGGSSEIDFTKINRDILEKSPHTRAAYIKGYESIRPIMDLERILPFYSFYDAFSSIAWCKRRGIEKNREFLTQRINILKRIVG